MKIQLGITSVILQTKQPRPLKIHIKDGKMRFCLVAKDQSVYQFWSQTFSFKKQF